MSRNPVIRIDADTLAPLLRIEAESAMTLQEQVRSGIIRAVQSDTVRPGSRLPSSRKLADRLGLSRNTVMLAYQRLIAEGHIEARERSGVFVPEAHTLSRVISPASDPAPAQSRSYRLPILGEVSEEARFNCPPDWQRYRFPFIEGRYDRSLFPTVEWREASRLALAASEVEEWSLDNGEVDDDALVDEIRTKLLPRRGITARPDELLITVGEQQALFLAAELFAGPGVTVGVENPGLPEMRTLIKRRGAKLQPLPVDDDGVVVDNRIDLCGMIHVSPSRQRPTAVTLSRSRRKALIDRIGANNLVVIEDDFECEMNYLKDSEPALRGMPGGETVIYVASLSKVLAPGVRLGYMVAPAHVITAARRLRDLTTRRASPNNQRAAAFFLSLGHYDAMLRRMLTVCEERRVALRDALNHYRPLSIAIAPAKGGTSYWVKGPDGFNANELVEAARSRGLLIEPADGYFLNRAEGQNMFRLGVTSIPASRIRQGVAELSGTIRDLATAQQNPPSEPLNGEKIRSALAGAALNYRTVYGEPCTIELHPDGRLSGWAGYAREDRDEGRWWVEGDLWFRQWNRWAYGEAAGFKVVIEGDRLSWLNAEGRRVDGAVIMPA